MTARAVRHSLGAEELIELGRSKSDSPDRKPFFMGRVRLGGNSAAAYLADRLSSEMGLLGRISGQEGLRNLVKAAPATREAVARILVLGSAAIGEGLAVDPLALGAPLAAFEGSGSPDENEALLGVAADRLAREAPAEIHGEIMRVLKVG